MTPERRDTLRTLIEQCLRGAENLTFTRFRIEERAGVLTTLLAYQFDLWLASDEPPSAPVDCSDCGARYRPKPVIQCPRCSSKAWHITVRTPPDIRGGSDDETIDEHARRVIR